MKAQTNERTNTCVTKPVHINKHYIDAISGMHTGKNFEKFNQYYDLG